MSKVKIVSDPYRRTIDFYSWEGAWNRVDGDSAPNSGLLGEKLTDGFFPFKACEILDVILDEYDDEYEELKIIFEGPDDEWQELRDACSSDERFAQISIDRGQRFLANARDILPLIREVFDELYPIIADQADGDGEANEQLRKFREASSNVIPVCVIGNYSTGKSTFINALVGCEILPSGVHPMTSRVFQIERSDQPDRAVLRFMYADEPVYIRCSEDGITVDWPAAKGRLFRQIELSGADAEGIGIADRVRAILTVINSYSEEDGEPKLSDLMQVSVPFGNDTDWATDRKIVIFDTPGANAVANKDHARVLKEAMQGMTDGLPIFVANYDGLDSGDNARLYEQINRMPALDEHFAMIVVNKADDVDLPTTDGEREWAMNTVVVQKLYAQGIYFVSSIVGLGAKTDGRFADRHYGRVFRRLKDYYEDCEDEDYTRLYDYDFLPGQYHAKIVESAEACPNLLLANSGLYSVEQGIAEFASKYSAYNKCSQSEALLHEIIEQTEDALARREERLEDARELFTGELDSAKESLIDDLRKLSHEARDNAMSGYLPRMNEQTQKDSSELGVSAATLQQWEEELTRNRQREIGAAEKQREAESMRAAVGTNFMSKVQRAWDAKDMLGFASVAKDFVGDVAAAVGAGAERDRYYHEADKEAARDLLEKTRHQLESDVARLSSEYERCSKEYWEQCAEGIRAELLAFVTSGASLADDQRKRLREVIIDYHKIELDTGGMHIQEIGYPFDPNKLWKAPLRLQYNMTLSQKMNEWRSIVETTHKDCFRNWLHNLEDKIINNAEDISPDLRQKVDLVKDTERDIEILQARRRKLRSGEERIADYMAWTEA